MSALNYIFGIMIITLILGLFVKFYLNWKENEIDKLITLFPLCYLLTVNIIDSMVKTKNIFSDSNIIYLYTAIYSLILSVVCLAGLYVRTKLCLTVTKGVIGKIGYIFISWCYGSIAIFIATQILHIPLRSNDIFLDITYKATNIFAFISILSIFYFFLCMIIDGNKERVLKHYQ